MEILLEITAVFYGMENRDRCLTLLLGVAGKCTCRGFSTAMCEICLDAVFSVIY